MNIPKIADAVGLIDERHIDFAIDYKRPRISAIKYVSAAACLIAALGACLFAASIKKYDFKHGVPDQTSVLPYTDPSGTVYSEDQPDTTHAHTDSMPEPFSKTGGDENADFYATVNLKLGYLDAEFCNIAGWDETEAWLDSAASANSDLTAVDELANLYSFIRHFDIPDSTVREILVGMRIGSEEDDFTDEEIDLLLSDDAEAVAEHFAADSAIVKGKNLYSPKWLYYHTSSDYAKAGITEQDAEKVLSKIDSFGLTDEAREAFEKKLSATMTYTGGTLEYNDGTIVYNDKMPLVQAEFTVIDEYFDPDADGHIFYLVSNDRSDKNIYACFYMYDQLIAAACDSPKSFPAYEAVFRFTDYYTEKQQAPVGAVVRLAWDGLADTEYQILRLPMLSRIQFSDSDTPYSQDELSALRSSLEGRYLDAAELIDDMWSDYRIPEDENTVKVSGTEPYKMQPESSYAESFAEELMKNAPIEYPDSVLTYFDGELYAETGYTLSEEEFAEFMYCAIPQPSAFRCSLPDGVEADYSEIIGTPEFKTGNFTLTDRQITGKLESNCLVNARLWQLIGKEFIFARLDEDIALPDGTVLHGWLFRRADEAAEESSKESEPGDYPEKLDFLNHLSNYNDDNYLYWHGGEYGYNRIILTKRNCEDFVSEAEFIGLSIRDYESRGDLCSKSLESGVPLYLYGDFILALPDEPEHAGEDFNADGQKTPVYIYGYLYHLKK